MNQEAKDIIKQLEYITAMGVGQSQIFEDFLEITSATLERLPAHLASRKAGQPLTDTEETEKLFARLHERYTKDYCWQRFSAAFQILVGSTWQWDDTIGQAYMEWGIPKKHTGQFFTPYDLCQMMARLTCDPDEIWKRLEAAWVKCPQGAMHALMFPERVTPFVREMGPGLLVYCAEFFEPIKVSDPCCGSGAMLLAAAETFPDWAIGWGLVQFYGQDIDRTCVQMAQINCMLYGLNGYNLKCVVALSEVELDAIPEPYRSKYQEAQSAEPERVAEITAEVRELKQGVLL